MTIEQLEGQRQSTIAAAKEVLINGGDMAEANRLHASAKSLSERIDMLKEFGNVPAPVAAEAAPKHEPWKSGSVVRNPFPGPKAEADYKAYAFGQWVRGTVLGNASAAKWCNEHGVKSQTEGDNGAGGYTVPEIVSSSLIWLRNEYGIARRYSRIYPMTSDILNVPNASTSTTTYYPGEATAITASDITFTQVALTAKKLAILTIVSKELNEDTVIDFGATLAQDFAYGLALAEDAAAFQGDGTSTYGSITGIMPRIKALSGTFTSIASMVVGPVGTAAALSSFTLANFQNMVAKLQPYATQPRWYMHKNVFYNGVADKLIALSGNSIMDIQNAYGPEPTLFGIPISFVQNMPSAPAASRTIAVLGDLSKGVAFGDRRGVSVEVSDQVKFIEDALTFKATERYAFNAFDVGNVTATAGDQVPGSLIVLQCAAS
jgi:HK97 family phage major capsid protein